VRTTILKYAIGAGLGGMLGLGAVTGFGHVLTEQGRTETVAASQMTQYCAPAHENLDAPRLYCGNEDGWSGPTGAAAFACFMQGIEDKASPQALDFRPCRIAMAATERTH
jgi:hypothetical protein